MFDVLRADEIGMSVTESLAMLPAASVSGFLSGASGQHLFLGRKDRPGPGGRLREADGAVESRMRNGP
jgi:hypothetical protein